MISFAVVLGCPRPIFAAYAQMGPAIFGTLLPHSKTPLCFGPKESKGGVFHLGNTAQFPPDGLNTAAAAAKHDLRRKNAR